MKNYITLLAILFGLTAHAQINISYSPGYGGYKMDNAKHALNGVYNSIKSDLPQNLKITEDFPGYVTHNLDLAYQIKIHEVGAKLSYYTTGGIIAYSDYSGKYKNSTILNGYRFGLVYRIHFWVPTDRFSVFCEISPAIIHTGFKHKLEYPFSNPNVQKQPLDKKSESTATIQPSLGSRFIVTESILLFAKGGYDALLSSKSDANWSGVRVEIGVTWHLKVK